MTRSKSEKEADGYFTCLPEGSEAPLHCLVMEKIEGTNLREYGQQNLLEKLKKAATAN